MKDQLRLLRTCIYNEIPAVVFQGDDSCAPEILEAAKEIYRRHGCSEDLDFIRPFSRSAEGASLFSLCSFCSRLIKRFLYDWQLLVDEVKAYQAENSARVKLPRLLPSEAETVRDEMARREAAG